LSTPTWSDSRPSFDKAKDDNIRLCERDCRIQIQFHTWSTIGYRVFFSGCVLIPISVIEIAFLFTAPWGWALFVFLFCTFVLLAFSMMVSTEFDLDKTEMREFWLILGKTIYVARLRYGPCAIVRLRRTKYESPNVMKLELIDGSRTRQVVEFNQFATREKAEAFGADLAQRIGCRFETIV
jgi:hypothetical protein